MKNVSIIIGLAVGCIVAGATGYIDNSSIKSAPAITFLWSVKQYTFLGVLISPSAARVHTFKIGVYAPAILPMLAVYSESVRMAPLRSA